MIKKILFFGIAIVLGLMVLMFASSYFQMNDMQDTIQEFMDAGDYPSIARSFLPYYDKTSVITQDTNDYFELVSVESITAEEATVEISGENKETRNYYLSYTFFFNHMQNIDIEGVSESDGKVHNYTRIVFLNGDKEYPYFFNDPETATSEEEEGVNRYFTAYIDAMGFVEIDVPLDDIINNLDGQITGYEFYDSKNNPQTDPKEPLVSCTFDEPLVSDTPFYNLGNELIDAWDNYLDGLSEDNLEAKAQEFTDFFDPDEGEGWLDRFNANTNFGTGINSYEDIIGSGYIVKTVIVMVIYVAICIVLGIFVLRNKNKVPKPYMRDEYKRQLVVAKQKETSNTTTESNTTTTAEDVVAGVAAASAGVAAAATATANVEAKQEDSSDATTDATDSDTENGTTTETSVSDVVESTDTSSNNVEESGDTLSNNAETPSSETLESSVEESTDTSDNDEEGSNDLSTEMLDDNLDPIDIGDELDEGDDFDRQINDSLNNKQNDTLTDDDEE